MSNKSITRHNCKALSYYIITIINHYIVTIISIKPRLEASVEIKVTLDHYDPARSGGYIFIFFQVWWTTDNNQINTWSQNNLWACFAIFWKNNSLSF